MTSTLGIKKQKDLIVEKDYIKYIHENFNLFTTAEAKRITRIFFKVVKEILKNEKNVYLRGLGELRIVNISPKMKYNMLKREHFLSEGNRTVRFKPTVDVAQRVIRKRGYVPLPELNQPTPKGKKKNEKPTSPS